MPLLNEKEAAKEISVSVATLRRWRRLNKGPAVTKPGGTLVRYDVEDIKRFIEESKSK